MRKMHLIITKMLQCGKKKIEIRNYILHKKMKAGFRLFVLWIYFQGS